MNARQTLTLCALLSVAACSDAPAPDVARRDEPVPAATRVTPPPGRDPQVCYGQDATPAVIETVTEQVMLQPAQLDADGKVLYPAVYKTETRQKIVRERQELSFETPCTRDLTPDFVASLQRALKVRGHYDGPVDGRMTSATRRAVRAYQKSLGLDSAILSREAARKLGLVAVSTG